MTERIEKMKKMFFTSESVTEGHPDKVCDQISDGILDAILEQDSNARCAIETAATTGMILVMGEITTNCYVDISKKVREILKDIGYTGNMSGFDADSCAVLVALDEQSKDIAMGVDSAQEEKSGNKEDYNKIGAGDQGIIFGYATNETEEYLSLSIVLAHKLTRRLATLRKNGELSYLRPDGKSQVTVEYHDGKAVHIDTVVISAQHAEEVGLEQIRREIIEKVITPTMPENLFDENTKIYVNPTGRFVVGGPQGDSGLTGRKIIVDTYGGLAHHGGGAFSGKDPTKVDRSAAYAARYVAKNLVAAGLCDRVEIGLSYGIGIAHPLSIYVESFGTAKISEEKLETLVKEHFDLRPAAIIDKLNLRRPIYRQTAAYGHFGRNDLDLPWERTDKAEELKKAL